MSDERTTVLQMRGVGLSRAGRVPLLHDVDLTLESGSFRFLTGATGSGKTTLLRLASLALRPQRGTIGLFGHETTRLRGGARADLRRRIGVVFQDFRLLAHLSAFDNVALPLRIAAPAGKQGRRDEEAIAGTVGEFFTWLGLEDAMEKKPPALSAGERQLVAVARAVVARPSLLLADEPSANVDGACADRLMTPFAQMQKLGSAVLLATRDQALLQRHPFPILRLEQGRLEAGEAGAARHRAEVATG